MSENHRLSHNQETFLFKVTFSMFRNLRIPILFQSRNQEAFLFKSCEGDVCILSSPSVSISHRFTEHREQDIIGFRTVLRCEFFDRHFGIADSKTVIAKSLHKTLHVHVNNRCHSRKRCLLYFLHYQFFRFTLTENGGSRDQPRDCDDDDTALREILFEGSPIRIDVKQNRNRKSDTNDLMCE